MTPRPTDSDPESLLDRSTRVHRHLDGWLDADTLSAMQHVWGRLEQSSVDPKSHTRAVRSRLFWETLAPVDGDGASEQTLGAPGGFADAA